MSAECLICRFPDFDERDRGTRSQLSLGSQKSGAMKAVGLAPKVEAILKITQLYQVFPEFPDEESALESFPKSTRSVTS